MGKYSDMAQRLLDAYAQSQNYLGTGADPSQTFDAAKSYTQSLVSSAPGMGAAHAFGYTPNFGDNYAMPESFDKGLNVKQNLDAGNYGEAAMQGFGGIADALFFGGLGAARVPAAAQRGMAKLFHEGPDNLPMNKPTANGHWFGNKDFFDTFDGEFGDTRYSYETPKYVDDGILDFTDKSNPKTREFVADLARKMYPTDKTIGDYAADVLAGKDDAFSHDNLYELFSSGRDEMSSLLENADDLHGVKYGDEYFLSPKTIERLQFKGKSQGGGGGVAMSEGLPMGEAQRGGGYTVTQPKENIKTVIDSNFESGRVIGDELVSIDTLHGGVGREVGDLKRVQALKDKISGPDGYIERLIVDTDGNVIEGQHRLDALRALGIKDVPILRIADNWSGVDVKNAKAAIKAAGPIHSDNINRVLGDSVEMLSEQGSYSNVLREYEGISPHHKAALRFLDKSGGGVAMSEPPVGEAGYRAIKGGEVGVNGYTYKGGQFLPNTEAPPGTWRIKSAGKSKNIPNGQELVAPGVMQPRPTPFSRSIYQVMGAGSYTNIDNAGVASVNPRINWAVAGGTPDTKDVIRFKDLAKSKETFSQNELIELYNNGVRWIDLDPVEGVEIVAKGGDVASAPKLAGGLPLAIGGGSLFGEDKRGTLFGESRRRR